MIFSRPTGVPDDRAITLNRELKPGSCTKLEPVLNVKGMPEKLLFCTGLAYALEAKSPFQKSTLFHNSVKAAMHGTGNGILHSISVIHVSAKHVRRYQNAGTGGCHSLW